MKQAVEEGLNVFLGSRLRVSLADCSLGRLRRMLELIDAECVQVQSEIEATEDEVRRLYATEENVELIFEGGRYRFPLDSAKERLGELRDRLDDLLEKRKPVFSACEEKILLERQARVLGGIRVVRAKDAIIFALILLVLVLLVVDAGNVGAPGGGARLAGEVVDGSIVSVEILDGGRDYAAAHAVPEVGADGGRGAEILLKWEDGRIIEATVASGGEGYGDEVILHVVPSLSPQIRWIFWGIDFLCCLIFLANFFFELSRAESKKWYWKMRWVDLVTSIPLPPAQVLAELGLSGSEALRAGRVLRVVRLLRALRALRLFLFMWRGLDHLAEIFDVRLMKKSLFAGLIVLALGALLITIFGERGEGHEAVKGFLPGLWWSFTTLVTGGFGDIYNPHTLGGRLLTVFLVIAGMVLVGVFTATLTTVLVGREERAQDAMQNEVLQRIEREGERSEQLLARLAEGQQQLSQRLDVIERNRVEAEGGKEKEAGEPPGE